MFDEIVTFSFPTRIVFGRAAVRRLPACLEETGVRKPLLVTDPGIRASPVFDAVVSALVVLTLVREERRRGRIAHAWLPVAATLLVGVSAGLPLVLYMRRETADPAPEHVLDR